MEVAPIKRAHTLLVRNRLPLSSLSINQNVPMTHTISPSL